MELFSRFVAVIVFLALLPVFLLISLISLTMQGYPVFYTQKRIGLNYKTFQIYKFRTMIKNQGDSITKHNDLRITPFGNILRKTKVDELPQLLNIIKGDMRFIGPRPEVETYFLEKDFTFLKKIKPGLSDFSSIIFQNEDLILKNIGGSNPYGALLPLKLALANYYAEQKSFQLDLKLVGITVVSIFAHKFVLKKLLFLK